MAERRVAYAPEYRRQMVELVRAGRTPGELAREFESRILTTHMGSLPRGEVLSDLLVRKDNEEEVDEARLAREIETAMQHVADRERLIAEVGCGFGIFAGDRFVAEDVVWAKLATLAEGAKLASARLW